MNRVRIFFVGNVWFRIVLLFLAFHSSAQAHMTIEGAGQIGGGVMHPLMTPSHVLILLSLALCLGQRHPLNLKAPMLIFSSVSAAALLISLASFVKELPSVVMIAIALLIAIVVAIGKQPSHWIGRVLCGIAALAIGLDSKVDSGTLEQKLKTLFGTWICINLLVAYIAAVAANGEEKLWVKTGVRVLGAWIIAITVMMIAFALRGIS